MSTHSNHGNRLSTNSHNHDKDAALLRTVGTVGTVALLAIGIKTGADLLKHGSEHALKLQRREALAATSTAHSEIIVLKSGARYRVSPQFEDGGQNDELDNRAGKVAKGKELIVHKPLSGASESWVSFTLPSTKVGEITSVKERMDKTVYANIDQLISDKKAVVLDQATDDSGVEITQPAHINPLGQVEVAGKVDPTAGISRELPAGTFENLSGMGIQIDLK